MAEPPATDPTSFRAVIRHYYEENQVLYDLFWSDRATLSMGYGFWDGTTRRLADALLNQHREIASRLHVRPHDVVLEAGCGVGGATVHLCAHHRARGIGITLSPMQARRGRRNAERRRVGGRAAFAVADFTCAGLAEGAFTRLFACESVCHAVDKRAFLAEAYRLLCPGGRLLVCDGFLARGDLSPDEERAYREWCLGWALPGLDTIDGFTAALAAAGFADVAFVDRTDAVLPSARRIRRLGMTLGVLVRGLHRLGLARPSQARHAVACLRQHDVLASGLARYGVFTAVRPEVSGGDVGRSPD
ncbi:MAG TPA: methyltransferase domain-containing protein [Vicinamibacteria bacterium]|nr:methyltransferase domain-containing protein [Vicinamibacteria bacterium]